MPKPVARRPELLASRARQMRFAPTHSEELLWRQLCASQLGVAFRRQVPLGGRYIADFFAPAAGLVVEVDGGYHERRSAADQRRDARLTCLGYRLVRLPASLVERDLSAAVAAVRAALAEATLAQATPSAATQR